MFNLKALQCPIVFNNKISVLVRKINCKENVCSNLVVTLYKGYN